jgi:drug/metabolite transporter (DMT)-like permease
MIYLLANVVFASSFGLLIKWIENRSREDIITAGMINYLVAAALSYYEFSRMEVAGLSANAMLAGGTMGTSYFIAFFFCVYAIRWIGVANSTVVGILSIVVPIVAGVAIWGESPSVLQWTGIVLALVALGLIGRKADATRMGSVPDRPWFTPWVVSSFFVLCGASRLAQEAFRHTSGYDQRPVFLISAFGMAAAFSLPVLLVRAKRVSSSEWLFGLVMGAANFLQSHFILKSLTAYDGFIVFPLTSAGCLMLVTLVATVQLGERLSRLTTIGIGLACVALLFLNWDSG